MIFFDILSILRFATYINQNDPFLNLSNVSSANYYYHLHETPPTFLLLLSMRGEARNSSFTSPKVARSTCAATPAPANLDWHTQGQRTLTGKPVTGEAGFSALERGNSPAGNDDFDVH